MIYNCVFPIITLTDEEKIRLGLDPLAPPGSGGQTAQAQIIFEQRTPVVGDLVLVAGLYFKITSVMFDLAVHPYPLQGEIKFFHSSTVVFMDKLAPGQIPGSGAGAGEPIPLPAAFSVADAFPNKTDLVAILK